MPEYTITDAVSFLEKTELADVGAFELVGFRGVVEEDGRAIIGTGNLTDIKIETEERSLGVFWLDIEDRLLVRLTFEFRTAAGDLRVGMQAEWTTGGLSRYDVSPAAEEDWVNKVAVMAILPYARSAIDDLSTRVFGTGLQLPLIRPGEITFKSMRNNVEDNPEDTSS